jgi:hypothetical protein
VDNTGPSYIGQTDAMLDILSMLAVAGLAIGLMMAARRLEPHWVSKDLQRFICRARIVDDHGVAIGGWNEYRFGFVGETLIEGRKRSMLGPGLPSVWKIARQLPDPPVRREIFLLTPETVDGTYLSIKVPSNSKLVPKMRAAIERTPESY